jgi:hypothetical protein
MVTEGQNLAVLRASKLGAKEVLTGEYKENAAEAGHGFNAGLTGKSAELFPVSYAKW